MTARRDFLAFTVGAVASGAVSPIEAALADNSDADLITVAKAAQRGMQLLLDADEDRTLLVTDLEFDAAWDRAHDLSDRLISMPATTMEGMAAKAAVMKLVMRMRIPTQCGATVEECGRHHDLLAWSLASDLLAGRVGS